MFKAEIPLEVDTTQDTSVFIDRVIGFLHDNLWDIVLAIVVLVAGLFIIKYVNRFLTKRLMKSHINPIMHGFTKALVKILLYMVLFITVASILHLPISTFVTVLGAAGLAISLSLQNSLSNVAANLMLLNAQMFAVGDYIEVSGASGTVSEIGLFNTLLLTPDNKHVYVPNSKLINNPLTNFSTEHNRRIDITVGVSYREDIDRVTAVLTDVAKRNPLVLRDPVPLIAVQSLGASAVNYLVRVWVANPDFWAVTFELNADIKRTLDRESIEIPYNQLDVHMIGGSDERV